MHFAKTAYDSYYKDLDQYELKNISFLPTFDPIHRLHKEGQKVWKRTFMIKRLRVTVMQNSSKSAVLQMVYLWIHNHVVLSSEFVFAKKCNDKWESYY